MEKLIRWRHFLEFWDVEMSVASFICGTDSEGWVYKSRVAHFGSTFRFWWVSYIGGSMILVS